tara:strand:- start:9175 stop:9486 length:312 start_codon:yes stop_codon:yes gene_type:complete
MSFYQKQEIIQNLIESNGGKHERAHALVLDRLVRSLGDDFDCFQQEIMNTESSIEDYEESLDILLDFFGGEDNRAVERITDEILLRSSNRQFQNFLSFFKNSN